MLQNGNIHSGCFPFRLLLCLLEVRSLHEGLLCQMLYDGRALLSIRALQHKCCTTCSTEKYLQQTLWVEKEHCCALLQRDSLIAGAHSCVCYAHEGVQMMHETQIAFYLLGQKKQLQWGLGGFLVLFGHYSKKDYRGNSAACLGKSCLA